MAKALAPPILVAAARRVVRPSELKEWEYVGDSWPTDQHGGWDVQSVVDTQQAKWQAFVVGIQAPNPMRHVPGPGDTPSDDGDYRFHNTALTFGYVLAQAARGRRQLTMLDWGGGLGQYAALARTLLPSVSIKYHCRELPLLAAAGQAVLPDDKFYDSDEAMSGMTFDLVVASSSLQYAPDWRTAFRKLADATTGYLYVTRVPIVFDSTSFVVLQRPHRYGYDTEYAGWILNRLEFLEAAKGTGLQLDREFLIMERHEVHGAPEVSESRGYLFARESEYAS